MAEMLSSAIIGETVNRIISNHITGKDEVKSQERGNIERLEMAHIKMESVLQMSDRWPITNVPLLRWRRKLKRASQECDETLRRCKQRSMEEEEVRQSVSQLSPKRIVHATTEFISSFTGYKNNNYGSGSNSSAVRRFERFAAGATEFLKYVELGGTPWEYMFFNPLIGHLLTGRSMRYQALQKSKYYYVGIRPMSFAERGVEAIIGFLCYDFKDLTKGFNLGFIIRLSESTDVFNIIIKCMESATRLTPDFKFAAEGVKKELFQLPTQDFSWGEQSPYGENELWVNVHHRLTHWSRPNPLCCNEHERIFVPSSKTSKTPLTSSSQLSSTFPEEAIVVLIQCHVSQCDRHSMGSASEHGAESSRNSDMPPLKLGVLFVPHDSPQDIEPSAESFALELIDEKEQGMIHNNVCLQYLDEKLLPKAIDHLYQNSESKMYQMCLKSRHGSAHLCVEKAWTKMQRGRMVKNKGTGNAQNKRISQQEDNKMERWKHLSKDIKKLWGQRPHVGQTYDFTNLMKIWALN